MARWGCADFLRILFTLAEVYTVQHFECIWIVHIVTAEIPHENYNAFLWTKENVVNVNTFPEIFESAYLLSMGTYFTSSSPV